MSEELFSQTPKGSGGFSPPVFRAVLRSADDLILLRQIRALRCCLSPRGSCDPYRRYLQIDVLTQCSFFFKLKRSKMHKTEPCQLLTCYFIWSLERFRYYPSLWSHQGNRTAPFTIVAKAVWIKTTFASYNCDHKTCRWFKLHFHPPL